MSGQVRSGFPKRWQPNLNGVDLDAEKLVGEILVEKEAVSVQHVLAARLLQQHSSPYLSVCEGLQGPPQLPVLDSSGAPSHGALSISSIS